jgi:ATP-dependent Clp protease adaptor protein ClpS
VEAFVLLVSSFAASGVLWTWQNRVRIREERSRKKQLETMLDEGMQIALALAKHEAASRNQPLAAIHILAALTQDEAVSAALEILCADRAGLEAALDAALDAAVDGPGLPRAGSTGEGRGGAIDPRDGERDPRDGTKLLGTALGIAHEHQRTMTCTDALAILLRSPVATILDRPPVTGDALLFQLVHGAVPPATLPRESHVHVVLRNDDYTAMQLVVHVLETVFALPSARAIEVTRAVHEAGRAVIGRYSVAEAQDKVLAARALAKTTHAPLWIGVEVC